MQRLHLRYMVLSTCTHDSAQSCHVPLQVIRGYTGDQSAEPIFEGTQLGRAFDTVGRGYQRPFELATKRLQNMAGVLSKCALLFACEDYSLSGGASQFSGSALIRILCLSMQQIRIENEALRWVRGSTFTSVVLVRAGSQLAPREERLLTQQGGALVLRGKQTVYRHDDSGILKYASVKELLAAAQKPAALPAPAPVR